MKDADVRLRVRGQNARLGFSIAIHVDSDIFLADEVLAVGDKPFKKKCIERMEEIKKSQGGSVLTNTTQTTSSALVGTACREETCASHPLAGSIRSRANA